MTLTGQKIKDSYKDVVQLEKSGAGLPGHGGAPAATYDGLGNLINAFLRQWNLFTPHPDASGFSETHEFAVMPDKDQTTLEGEGWTFENCSGEVENGTFWLGDMVAAGAPMRAVKTVSFTGDFDVVAFPVWAQGYGEIHGQPYSEIGLMVGDTVGDDQWLAASQTVNGYCRFYGGYGGLWSNGSSHSLSSQSFYNGGHMVRIKRVSGTLRETAGTAYPFGACQMWAAQSSNLEFEGWGWTAGYTQSTSVTMNRLALSLRFQTGPTQNGRVAGFRFLRRFQ
jgi:hypothetical protein